MLSWIILERMMSTFCMSCLSISIHVYLCLFLSSFFLTVFNFAVKYLIIWMRFCHFKPMVNDLIDEIFMQVITFFLLTQSTVYGSLDMSRSNSMTNAGQCRLAPLIPCIQDSTQLYDFSVKVLFKLHAGKIKNWY